MNPIRNMFQQGVAQPQQGGFNPFANFQNTMQQFNQFRQSFQGDPQQVVQNMLQNGQMNQQQFDYYSNMARQFQQMMGR